MPLLIFSSVVGAALLAALIVILLGSGRGGHVDGGRGARLWRIGRLSARLSASWLGARARRLFAGKARRARLDEAQRLANAKRVAETMGQMKGAFMKLGQMLSFVSDQIPAEYRAALASLQAAAPPMDFALLRDVAERELGKPLERAFARFDETPLASASIGQVHRARLPTGEEVVVKIQYPGVADAIRADLSNAELMYRMAMMFYPGVDVGPIVDELRGRVIEELDYALEARNQRAFADLYDGHPFIRVPRVVDSHSTARVLTSEFVDGRRFADVVALDEPRRARYGEILYRFVFGSIHGFRVFNGDPHPGNYLFDADGRMVFLDFGCVKYFPEGMVQKWKSLLRLHLDGRRAEFRAQLIALGFFKADAPVDAEVIYDYFGYFYEPFHEDRAFTFTREYNAKSFGLIFKPEGKFAGLAKLLNMPRDFVFVNRIQWGIHSILADLGATANWHRIEKELLFHEPPSTELGRADAEWRARWRRERNLDGVELRLTPDGCRPVDEADDRKSVTAGQ
ncbi:MAG TPA: AarF/ABC1/UbiB kinase family protein [Polyangia bacterium]|nr:AarF/ABC1/UbiB kinase family protein [Polyangia bacterium]